MTRPPLATVLRRVSRRDLMKLAPLAAAGAGVAALTLTGTEAGAVEHHTGTCRFCLMHCGITTAVQDGTLLKVEGALASRTRGFVCEHGFALREVVHSRARLRHPLVRRGDLFHEVQWRDALAEVAQKLQSVKARWGPEALVIQTGWPLVRHPLVNWLHRLGRAFGTPNVASVASLCEASLRMGQALTVGSKYSPDFKRAKTLVVWGANPSVTAPPLAAIIASKASQGALIVVDPVRTGLAREATEHVSIRPGTDGALALGLIDVVVRNGWFDAAFVREHTLGFEALVTLAASYPTERVEQLTGVPRTQVERVARLMATGGPLGIWQGLGVEHHENGVQTVRAISSLETLCGRFDGTQSARSILTPVGPRFAEEPLPALYRMATPEPVPPAPRAKALGRDEYPLYEMYNREAQGQLLADAVLDDKPYPVRALLLVASNALVTSAGAQRLEAAAEALELLVAIDPFLSRSAQRADVVLPAATFAEAPDVDDDSSVSAGSLVPPQGEAWSDWKIVVELARALGLGAYFPWATMHEAAAAPHVPWMLDVASQPHPEATAEARFGTVTGKVEFTSSLLERAGYAALPEWSPPEPTTAEYPLRLVTGPRPRAFINSQFHDAPSIRARLREPEALVAPAVAERFHLAHGQRVAVVSPFGRVVFRAVVTSDVHPDTVVVPAGFAEANANALIGPRKDPISGFPAFRSGLCRVEPVTAEAATPPPLP